MDDDDDDSGENDSEEENIEEENKEQKMICNVHENAVNDCYSDNASTPLLLHVCCIKHALNHLLLLFIVVSLKQ